MSSPNINKNNNINPKSCTYGYGLQIYCNLPTKNIGEKYLQKRNLWFDESLYGFTSLQKHKNHNIGHITNSTVINGILVDKGQGINGPNTHFHAVLHAVIHPNGEVTGEVDNVEIKCEGGSEDSSVMDLLENIL